MKLVWLFGMVVLAFVGLGIRITVINASQGNQYSKQVLSQSQQKYDSRVIPFKRGDANFLYFFPPINISR